MNGVFRRSIISEINVKQFPNFVSDAQKSSTFNNSLLLNNFEILLLRLVFTRDGVVVGVVIRRVERYDLVN